jgi:hypothetical protein
MGDATRFGVKMIMEMDEGKLSIKCHSNPNPNPNLGKSLQVGRKSSASISNLAEDVIKVETVGYLGF